MDRVIVLEEFIKFEESTNDLRASTSDGYNDDEFTSEDLHHSIDIKEDIPIVDYQQDSNENTRSHSNSYFQIKTEIAEETKINFEDFHHSIDVKEATSMNESQTVQDCDVPLSIHTGKKSFECNVCDYKCSQKGSLKIHLLIHTGAKPFRCNICSYKCLQRGRLNEHLRTHTGEKPYECNICDYKSPRRIDLKVHLRTHTGEKSYGYNIYDYKNKQLRTHAGKNPYECKICGHKCTPRGYCKHRLVCCDTSTSSEFTASLKTKFKALLH